MGSDEARLEELLKSMMNEDSGHAPSGTVVSGLDALKALQEEPAEATSLNQIFDFSENSVLDFSNMPEDFDIPDATDVSETMNMSDVMDMSETMNMSDVMDMSETMDMSDTMDMTEAMGVADIMNLSETMDISEISEDTSIMDLMGMEPDEEAGNVELDFTGADNISSDELDLTALFGNNDSEDLADIQDMLSKSDNHELLEDNSKSDMEDLFDLFATDTMEMVADETIKESETIEDAPKKEKKKLFGGRKKKEKKKKFTSEEDTAVEDVMSEDSGDIDIFGMEREEMAQEEDKPKKKKRSEKTGFFKKMGESLFGEDEEEREPIPDDANITLSDENAEVLEQLSEEDASKSKKKKEKKRKNKNKEEKTESNAADENAEEEIEETPAKKKVRKPKREKKKKVYEEEKPAKKVSKKKVKSVVWVCLTILAIVMLLKTVGMNMLEMTEARDAYFVGDYKKAYELFTGDELKASDKILMEKATIIVRLSHAVETYENHVKLGKKLEALDDLMQGVAYYSEVETSEKLDYITSDATAEYHKILELLNADFGLSQQDAKTILEEKDLYVYNLQLQDIVDGKPYVRPGEEPEVIEEEKIVLDDMLPEDEEYLNGSNN